MAKQENKLRTTVAKTVNPNPLPEVQQIQPDTTPFVYTPGTSVLDIIKQGKRQEEVYQAQEVDLKKQAKLNAYMDFFKSLGGLAGGGWANVQQYQPSPYLTQAFGKIDQLRQDKQTSQQYYDEMARRGQKEDYNTQLSAYNRSQDKNFQIQKANTDALNRRNLEQYKMGAEKVTTIDDPLAEKRAETSAFNAQTARIRAEKGPQSQNKAEKKEAEEKEVIYTLNKPEGSTQITKERATKLVERVEKDLKDNTKILSPEEEQIREALKDAKLDKKALIKAIDLIRKYDKTGKYKGYWIEQKKEDTAPKSFLPQSPKTQSNTPKKSLLPK
jgi:hypothetical protein